MHDVPLNKSCAHFSGQSFMIANYSGGLLLCCLFFCACKGSFSWRLIMIRRITIWLHMDDLLEWLSLNRLWVIIHLVLWFTLGHDILSLILAGKQQVEFVLSRMCHDGQYWCSTVHGSHVVLWMFCNLNISGVEFLPFIFSLFFMPAGHHEICSGHLFQDQTINN